MSRIEGIRLVAGFAFAPAVGVLVLLLALAVNSALTSDAEQNYGFLTAFGAIAAYVAYSVTFIIALPLFILFRVRGWLRPWQLATGGFLVGALVGLLPGTHIAFVLMFCAVGATTGLAFWIIAIFQNGNLIPGSRSDE